MEIRRARKVMLGLGHQSEHASSSVIVHDRVEPWRFLLCAGSRIRIYIVRVKIGITQFDLGIFAKRVILCGCYLIQECSRGDSYGVIGQIRGGIDQLDEVGVGEEFVLGGGVCGVAEGGGSWGSSRGNSRGSNNSNNSRNSRSGWNDKTRLRGVLITGGMGSGYG